MKQNPNHNPALFLKKAADLYEERHKVYGNNYKRFGGVMSWLFPQGVKINSVADWNRLGVLVQIAGKLTRYAENFDRGGHEDSLDDMSVYSMMLKELDMDAKERDRVEAEALKDES